MRVLLIAIPFALIAAPAAAQEPRRDWQVPSELTDPAMADKLGRMAGALAKAMMDMPVGEIQAAVEGRAPTAADRSRRIRDVAGNDPLLQQKIERGVAEGVPRMQAGMRAMAAAMPAMIGALEKAAEDLERELDRATANLPDPAYPRR